jgi:ArsR family transcriptional regulator
MGFANIQNHDIIIIVLAYTNISQGVVVDDVEKLAEIFKALSDPTRLRLIKLLNECSSQPDKCGGGSLCVNALTNKLGVTQSAVSQHLRILRQVGLVRSERRGSFVHYSLDPDGLKKYRASLVAILGEYFARV